MKKVILVFAAIVISFGAYAQTDSTGRKMSPPDINNTNDRNNQNYDRGTNKSHDGQNHQMGKSHPDGAMMHDGKMMMVKDGKMTVMNHDMTMTNGTRIMSDGTMVKKDGTKVKIKEGQHMDMSGNMTPMRDKNDPNMYLVPDSTNKRD